MNKLIPILLTSFLLLSQPGRSNAASAQSRPEVKADDSKIVNAKTVTIVAALGEVKMTGRGYLDANPDRGKAKVEEVLQKWGRFTLLDDPEKADLVLLVIEGNHLKLGIQGQLYDELLIFPGGQVPDENSKPIWRDEAKEGFKALPATKVAEKFRKYVEALEKNGKH